MGGFKRTMLRTKYMKEWKTAVKKRDESVIKSRTKMSINFYTLQEYIEIVKGGE